MSVAARSAATTVQFAEAARGLAERCRARGLAVPGFRSPPAHPTASRTIRRRPDGSAIVAVRVRGRPLGAVVADMVDGVIAVNRLTGAEAEQVRAELLAEVQGDAAPARAA
jgi:hypothetical protein